MYTSWAKRKEYLCSHFRVNAAMSSLPMTLAVSLREEVSLFYLFIYVSKLISVIILCPKFLLLLISRLSPIQNLMFLIFELWTFPLEFQKQKNKSILLLLLGLAPPNDMTTSAHKDLGYTI